MRNLRAMIPPAVDEKNIYIKLFKNIPRTRRRDGVSEHAREVSACSTSCGSASTGGAGLGMGVFGAAGKIAVAATNPLVAAGAVRRPRRRRLPAGDELPQPEAALHGRDGAEPLFPRHGRQSRRPDQARRPRGRGGREGGDAALQRARPRRRPSTPTCRRSTRRSSDTCWRASAWPSTSTSKTRSAGSSPTASSSRRPTARCARWGRPKRRMHLDAKWDVFLDNLPDPAGEEGREVEQTIRTRDRRRLQFSGTAPRRRKSLCYTLAAPLRRFPGVCAAHARPSANSARRPMNPQKLITEVETRGQAMQIASALQDLLEPPPDALTVFEAKASEAARPYRLADRSLFLGRQRAARARSGAFRSSR